MTPGASAAAATPRRSTAWRSVVARYQVPDVGRAVLQLATTLIPFGALLWVMYQTLSISYWLTLALAIPAAGLLVRTFVIMHDCVHGSFLPWRAANEAVGFCTGLLTFTAFSKWRRDHALHHASSGDLDRRGHGDVPTLTVKEYLERTRWGRLRYRLLRHPLLLLSFGPLTLVIGQRMSSRNSDGSVHHRRAVWLTNGALVAIGVLLAFTVGLGNAALVYLPVYYLAAVVGVWLFYVQHQFEGTYWADHEEWDYATAAVRGSSYFKLPTALRWMTGSIGLHHVHHLGPRIPNYYLQRCHDENELFHEVTVVSLRGSLAAMRLRLWDEERRRLVSFKEAEGERTAETLR